MRALATGTALAVLLVFLAGGAAAQSPKPPSPEDTLLAYDAAKLSRSAVRDQLVLCAEDADKLDQVFNKLRPAGAADRGDWKDWAELYRRTGGELISCLRAYSKQMSLHRRDLALLRDRLPLLKEPKRLTVSPKQVAEINSYAAGLEKELAGYDARARAMALGAEQASVRVGSLLRDAGIANAEVPTGFAKAL